MPPDQYLGGRPAVAFGDGGDLRWAKALKVSTNLFSAGCGQWIRYRSR
jgi:hypothetical protein